MYFFNVGRVFTAHNLAKEMSRTTVELLTYKKSQIDMADIQDEFDISNLPEVGILWQGQKNAVVTCNHKINLIIRRQIGANWEL